MTDAAVALCLTLAATATRTDAIKAAMRAVDDDGLPYHEALAALAEWDALQARSVQTVRSA